MMGKTLPVGDLVSFNAHAEVSHQNIGDLLNSVASRKMPMISMTKITTQN
jgi:hypothetical protein